LGQKPPLVRPNTPPSERQTRTREGTTKKLKTEIL